MSDPTPAKQPDPPALPPRNRTEAMIQAVQQNLRRTSRVNQLARAAPPAAEGLRAKNL